MISEKPIVRIGIIGCGDICSYYINGCRQFSNIKIVSCADKIDDKAKLKAAELNIPTAYSIEELLSDPEVDIVLNLTIPSAHAEVGIAALEAGKHVYSEKPLAVTCKEGRSLLDTAVKKQLIAGCAPDTFLGGGLQTCRKIIDEGRIGDIIGCNCFMMSHGTEDWHPNPGFHYKYGSGPLFEMGPYYLTALLNLIGPVQSVFGSGRMSFTERTITSEPRFGEIIKVEVLTHITAILNFHTGIMGTLSTSFDVWATKLPFIEIYGSKGTLLVPDPNTFGGPVKVQYKKTDEWEDVPLTFGYSTPSRGLGLADMADAIQNKRIPRASGLAAYHVLETMCAIQQSCAEGKTINIKSSCGKPAPMGSGVGL